MIDCKKPDVPIGGELIGDKFTVNAEISYKCKPGHKMIGGNEFRRCTHDAKWDGSMPECKCEWRASAITIRLPLIARNHALMEQPQWMN